MMERKLQGAAPETAMPKGATDCQMHMYLPGYTWRADGKGVPRDPLPTPQMYRQVMGWLGLERVVITQGNGHGADNASLLACLQQMGDCARGVAVVSADTSRAELRALADAGVTGARIMDLPGGAVGLDQLEAVDDIAHEMGWMIAVQFDGSALPEMETRLHALKSNWVLDHHGKIFSGITDAHVAVVQRLIDTGRMWFKFAGCYEATTTSGPDYPDIAAMARQIGAYAPERIVWGTNWPHNMATSAADYPDDAQLLDLAMGWLPDDAARTRVLVDNPQTLYGFAQVS